MQNINLNIRNTEVITGIFALLAGLSLIATILTRFEFISFFSSFSDDLEYLKDNLPILKLNSIIWITTSLILTVSASTFIVMLNPFHRLLSWLTGFFLILSAAMMTVSAIKGFGIIDILTNYEQLNLSFNESLTINIFTLAREKEIFITTSYTLLGLAFFSLGIFALRNRRLSIFTGLISLLTGIILPVFTGLIPESLLADLGLLAGCITFLIIGVRLSFGGIGKEDLKTVKSERKK